jgi:hypothetical protein
MAQESRLFDAPGPAMTPSPAIAPRTAILRTTRVTSDSKQLSAGMAATLSAELGGRVSPDLVADVVRAVLDESRPAGGQEAAESAMTEARKRLRRFIRARLPG